MRSIEETLATSFGVRVFGYIRIMKELEFQVPDKLAVRIERAGQELGISPAELVRISVEEKMARDSEFQNAAERVLRKNAELYERLSGK